MSAVGGLRIGVSAIEHGNSMLSIMMATECYFLCSIVKYPVVFPKLENGDR